jgi:hypothetical protein
MYRSEISNDLKVWDQQWPKGLRSAMTTERLSGLAIFTCVQSDDSTFIQHSVPAGGIQKQCYGIYLREKLIDWLFAVLRPAQEFFTNMEPSPLPVKGCKICSALRTFEQGGIFIVPHPLWHRVSVFPVLSERPPHLVASYDTQGMWRIYSYAGPHGSPFSRFLLKTSTASQWKRYAHHVYLRARDPHIKEARWRDLYIHKNESHCFGQFNIIDRLASPTAPNKLDRTTFFRKLWFYM